MRQLKCDHTIADNGKGIPDALRATLFDPFKERKVEWNGLGLWIVREVQRCGGTIKNRSNRIPGKSGRIFRIALPIQAAA
jgi:signal transduction histidine kinase